MDRVIYKYNIPVDDQWHDLALIGEILHVAAPDVDSVKIWAMHNPNSLLTRTFRVFGTGHPIPWNGIYRGTALTPSGRLVWHLIEQDVHGS